VLAEGVEPPRLHLFDAALGNDEGALPVVAAVEHHHHLAGFDVAESLGVVGRLARQAEPQHVHRRAVVVALQAGLFAHRGMPAVGADDAIGAGRPRAPTTGSARIVSMPSGPLARTPTMRPPSAIRSTASLCMRRSKVL